MYSAIDGTRSAFLYAWYGPAAGAHRDAQGDACEHPAQSQPRRAVHVVFQHACKMGLRTEQPAARAENCVACCPSAQAKVSVPVYGLHNHLEP
jgi:hypothetical protein